MSAIISNLTATNTFGDWLDKTNTLSQQFATTIQTGGANQNEPGNVTIRGHIITPNTVFTDTIDVYTETGTLNIAAPVKTAGKIEIDNVDNVSAATGVEFKQNNVTTWEVFTSDDHSDLYLRKANGDKLTILGSKSGVPVGTITATNLKIDNGILPATITQETVNATVGGTFASLTISGANPITGQISSIENHDTSALAEDPSATTTSGTMYFTEARARNAIDAEGSLSYNAATGKISYTERTDAEIKALITAGTGVSVNDGQVSIGQNVATSAAVQFSSVKGTLIPGTNWSIVANSTKLEIKYNNVTIFSVATNGAVTASNNITAYGTP